MNEALEEFLGIQGYSIYLKGYGILLEKLSGILRI